MTYSKIFLRAEISALFSLLGFGILMGLFSTVGGVPGEGAEFIALMAALMGLVPALAFAAPLYALVRYRQQRYPLLWALGIGAAPSIGFELFWEPFTIFALIGGLCVATGTHILFSRWDAMF